MTELTLQEMETTITYTQADDTISIFTEDPNMTKKLMSMVKRFPKECTLDTTGKYGSTKRSTFTIPKKCLSIRPPALEISEEQREKKRQQMLEMNKNRGLK